MSAGIGAGVISAFGADDTSEEDWMPVEARKSSDFDWIELTSGEWLKGDFLYMYEDSVRFDSDILGEVDIDWGDIEYIRFHKPMGVRLDNRTVHLGQVSVSQGVVSFLSTQQEIRKDQVVSIAPIHRNELSRWEIEGKVAFDFQSGNTDETRYTTTLSATRRTVSTRFNASYIGNYTKTDGSESANNHRASSNFDYFFDERLYIRAIDGEYYRDHFQNINNQVTIGAGVGYKIVDTSDFDWELQIGPAYQYTEFSEVPTDSDRTVNSPALVISSTLDYDITSDLELNLNYQGVLTNRDSGLYTQHIVTSLDYELTSIFDIFLMVQLDRVENPQEKSDGT
ncbi:MAG: DUF481 domain-containing protein, partial [Puniceicoccales bacterium]